MWQGSPPAYVGTCGGLFDVHGKGICMTTLYVSPTGNDTWSGRLPEANAERTDGPLATVSGARNRVRHRSQPPAYHNRTWAVQGQSGPVTVQLRGGVYPLGGRQRVASAGVGLRARALCIARSLLRSGRRQIARTRGTAGGPAAG